MHPDLVRLANEASTSMGFEAAVLDLFQRRVGFDVAFFAVKGEEAKPTVVGLNQAWSARQFAVAHGMLPSCSPSSELPSRRAAWLSTRGYSENAAFAQRLLPGGGSSGGRAPFAHG